MEDCYREARHRIEQAVLGAKAETSLELRPSIAYQERIPLELAPFVEKVRENAYRVTDADIERLKHLGHSEDAIFELAVCAAVAGANSRLDAALRILEIAHAPKNT